MMPIYESKKKISEEMEKCLKWGRYICLFMVLYGVMSVVFFILSIIYSDIGFLIVAVISEVCMTIFLFLAIAEHIDHRYWCTKHYMYHHLPKYLKENKK